MRVVRRFEVRILEGGFFFYINNERRGKEEEKAHFLLEARGLKASLTTL